MTPKLSVNDHSVTYPPPYHSTSPLKYQYPGQDLSKGQRMYSTHNQATLVVNDVRFISVLESWITALQINNHKSSPIQIIGVRDSRIAGQEPQNQGSLHCRSIISIHCRQQGHINRAQFRHQGNCSFSPNFQFHTGFWSSLPFLGSQSCSRFFNTLQFLKVITKCIRLL